MKTIATMALLLGTIAVGIAPAAEAREARAHGHAPQKTWNTDARHGHASPAHPRLHAREVREIRTLAVRLERATDELRRDAARVAGRRDRGEAHALRALGRLETSADRFRRQTVGRDVFEAHELRRDLRLVQEAFRHARHRSRALRPSRDLHRGFNGVGALIEVLDETLEPGRRMAVHGWPYLARR